MAAWRRRALELFPRLRRELTRRDSTPYSLFADLLPMVRAAHDEGDRELMRHLYGFAEWCARQTAKELWNPAGVSFYEHLFDRPTDSERVVPWLTPFVAFTHWELWEAMAAPVGWGRARPLLEAKRAKGERQFRAGRRH